MNPVPICSYADKRYRTCCKCKSKSYPTLHHVYPKRFFQIDIVVPFCRGCHDELEKLIPKKEKMSEEFYWSVIFYFVQSA